MKTFETAIIGAGQAGLGTSYHLMQAGKNHIVLEQSDHAAPSWRSRCWDSFTLVTPNQVFRIPGITLEEDPNGFLPREKIIQAFEKYASTYNLPIQYNTQVSAVEFKGNNDYLVQTSNGSYRSKNIVVATGFFQRPRIPSFSRKISKAVHQIHSSSYRNTQSIAKGAVLVVGSGQSGAQIAEELNVGGKKVFLATGTAGRAPRRYRGKDIIEWLEVTGFFNLTPDQLPPGMSKFEGIPHLSGNKGGHTLNLHRFAREGVKLLGHMRNADDYSVTIAPDLHENLEKVDQFERDLTGMIDEFIQNNNLDAPPEQLETLSDGYSQPIIEMLNLVDENIGTIIWAIGYTFDYSFIKLPVLDSDGFPIQNGGITNYPGLYFVGMPWMPTEKSGFLGGVGEAAKRIADDIKTAGFL